VRFLTGAAHSVPSALSRPARVRSSGLMDSGDGAGGLMRRAAGRYWAGSPSASGWERL
jgi:hypothetical protein